ncbi:MAG TPA: TIGR03435 family protein [Bryobacteraceae bacterium]|jgi:uncharacterized protein (TIGR03435 family)
MARFGLAARLVGVALMMGTGAVGQDAASLPRFEVASVKLNASSDTGSQNDLSGAGVVFRNYVLGGIVQTAFNVNRLDMEVPDWFFSERFDITAKVPDPKASLEERRRMLQALLVDRFSLTFHRETKMRAGYALVVAKNGPKIKPVDDVGGHNNDNRPGKMQRQRTTIGDLAPALAFILKQPVVDVTRMEGRYNVVLTYAPDSGVDAAIAGGDGPSLFTALEEQLGLKLEARKVPGEVFVVDQCRRMPREN